MSQKLDKELEKALAVLESERNDALKNLDSQVHAQCTSLDDECFWRVRRLLP